MLDIELLFNKKKRDRTGTGTLIIEPAFRTARLYRRMWLFGNRIDIHGNLIPFQAFGRQDNVAALRTSLNVNKYLHRLHTRYFDKEQTPDGKRWARLQPGYLKWKTTQQRSRRYGTKPALPPDKLRLSRSLLASMHFGAAPTGRQDEYWFGPDPDHGPGRQLRRGYSKSYLGRVQVALYEGRQTGTPMVGRPYVGTKQSNARDLVQRAFWNSLTEGINR